MSDWPLHPFLAHPGARAIAHRGGAAEAEENTLPAFAHAAALGFTHVELDVHATRDGVVVIHHDATLTRLCDDPRTIADMDYAELRKLRTKAGNTIPRLADLLEEHPEMNIAIEAKSRAVIAPLCSLLERMDALDRVSVGGFDPVCTDTACATLGARLCWSPAHAQIARLWAASWGAPLGLAAFHVAQVPARWHGIPVSSAAFVHAAHKRGIKVQVWTVNDPAQMHALLDIDVDGVMSDHPSKLKQVLQDRGAWHGG